MSASVWQIDEYYTWAYLYIHKEFIRERANNWEDGDAEKSNRKSGNSTNENKLEVTKDKGLISKRLGFKNRLEQDQQH